MGQSEELKVTSVEQRRKAGSFLFRASPNLVCRIRKMDMTDMILNKLIPMPLLKAAQRYSRIQKGQEQLPSQDEASIDQKIDDIEQNLSDDTVDRWNEFLNHYVSVVVLEPKITLSKTPGLDELSIMEISGDEKIAILNAKPQDEVESQEGVPRFDVNQADDFRGNEQRPDGPAVQSGVEVRAETKLLDSPEREFIHA